MEMYYVFENQNNLASWVKGGEHLTEEQVNGAVALNELSKVDAPEGLTPVLKCDKENNRVWYDYEELEVFPVEEIKKLRQQLEMQQILLDDLLISVIPTLTRGEM